MEEKVLCKFSKFKKKKFFFKCRMKWSANVSSRAYHLLLGSTRVKTLNRLKKKTPQTHLKTAPTLAVEKLHRL